MRTVLLRLPLVVLIVAASPYDALAATRIAIQAVAAKPEAPVQDRGAALREIADWAGAVTQQTATIEAIQNATKKIRECGASGDRKLAAQLGKIAEACSERYMQTLALEALDAQWQLGVPVEKFLELAGGHASRPNLASYAAYVASRVLDEKVLARIDALTAEVAPPSSPPATLMAYGVHRARVAIGFRLKLQSMELAPRISELAQSAVGGHLAMVEAPFEPMLERADPVTVFARAELTRLSAAQPVEVARILRASALNGIADVFKKGADVEREKLLNECRDWVATFLAPASLAEYRALPVPKTR
jgi:hypothetical protein